MRAKIFGAMAPAWRVLLTGFILVGLLSGAALADKAITGVDITNKADRVVISVQGNSALKMATITSSAGRFLAFQFPGALQEKGRFVGIRSGRIYNVRYSNFKPNPTATRIVVNTASCLKYSTEWSKDRTQVDITVWKYGIKLNTQPAVELAPVKAEKPISTISVPVEDAKSVPVMSLMEHGAKGSDSGDEPAPQIKHDAKPQVVAMLPSAAPEQSKMTSDGRKVSLNFLGADINDVLKAISVQSGRNIVSGKDVTGSVTISLADVTVDQAMGYVAKMSGYSYAKLNDTYVVGSKSSVRTVSDGTTENSKVMVVAMNYASMDDTMAFLKNEFPEMKFSSGNGGSDKPEGDKSKGASKAGGLIVMSGPEGVVNQAKQMVAQIDDSMKDLMGEMTTDVYKVKYVNTQELATSLSGLMAGKVTISFAPSEGFDLTAPEPAKIGTNGGSKVETKADTAPAVARPQALIISGQESNVKQAMDLAAKLDIKSPQIKIEAKVTSLTETGEKKLGLAWDWNVFKFTESIEGLSPTDRYYRGPNSISAKLDALIEEGNGTLLAAPNLMCLEGKPGVFFVGDEITYIIRVETTPTGQNVVTQTSNVGVELRVVADVSSDGSITLNLHPEVSTLELVTDQTAKITLPKIKRRFTDHTIRVKSGETIVIGGLIRDDELDTLTKVPLLGDIPVLGKLFRHKDKSKSHSEVVMFITASVLND